MTGIRRYILFLSLLFIAAPWILTDSSGENDNPHPEIFAVYVNESIEIDPATVKMYIDGINVTHWASITPTRISYIPLKPLEPGIHWVKVVVDDSLKNISGEQQWSFMFSFSVTDAEIQIDSLKSPTNQKMITVSGVTIPGVEVELMANNIHRGFSYSQSEGRFDFPAIELEEGENIISAIARDPITDEVSREYRAEITVLLDSTPPIFTHSLPGNGDSVVAPCAAISLYYNDKNGTGVDIDSLDLLVDDKPVIPQHIDTAACTYLAEHPLEPGTHKVQFAISDNLGNTSDPGILEFQIITPDTATFPSSIVPGKYSPIEIIAPPKNSPATFINPSRLNELHQLFTPTPVLTVTPTATMGNYQYEPPNIQSPQDGQVFRNPEITVSGVANRNLFVQLFINNNLYSETSSDKLGNFMITHVFLAEGENNLQCRVVDRRGGMSNLSETIVVTYAPLLLQRQQPYQKKQPRTQTISEKKQSD
jgi:hypothetical protein